MVSGSQTAKVVCNQCIPTNALRIMKTIYCSFQFLFIAVKVETELAAHVYSSRIDDTMFYVFDHDASVDEFNAAQREVMQKLSYTQHDQCYSTQRRFHQSEHAYQQRRQQVIDSLLEEIAKVNAEDYNVVL